MEIPRYQGRSPSRKQERVGDKDRNSRVEGYERLLSGMEILRHQSRSPSQKQERVGKDKKGERQDMKAPYLVWKSRDTRVGVLHGSKR